MEVAPHLRLIHLDQSRGPYLAVASPEPRPGAVSPNGFYLRHLDDGVWLRGYEAGPENVDPPDCSDFVFRMDGPQHPTRRRRHQSAAPSAQSGTSE